MIQKPVKVDPLHPTSIVESDGKPIAAACYMEDANEIRRCLNHAEKLVEGK